MAEVFKHRGHRSAAILLAFVSVTFFGCTQSRNNRPHTLRVGIPLEWNKDLIPALQHSAVAASILSNEFETLVRVGKGGEILPMAAKSWKISNGNKKLSFVIDRSRRFSNGTVLSAKHFKESWEMGLKILPRSSNSGLLDTLKHVEGFENFKKSGRLSGIKAVSDETLEIHFSKSFRTVLNFLSSPPLSATIEHEGTLIGTGPYVLTSNTGHSATLKRNKYFQAEGSFEVIHLVRVPKEIDEKMLVEKNIDVVMFSEITSLDCAKNPKFGCYEGLESSHDLFFFNGVDGKIFSKKYLRLAAVYVLHSYFSEQPDWDYDPQIYLKLQAGRLDNKVVEDAISRGKKFVPDLVAASAKKPLSILATRKGKTSRAIEKALEASGVRYQKTETLAFQEYLEDYYKKFKFDIHLGGASVHHGDPDGMYHLLGKSGAISSPMLIRPTVEPLLEEGRTLLNRENLHGHYQKVSEAVLKDAPFFHPGFRHTQMLYSKSTVAARKDLRNRNDFGLVNFVPR